ncbi:MAG: class I SAM-dependent methyltransferase [Balneolaceae bacterium]|nr:MAG: class I SAM-dependent methyltransferase [Balneolaceae bacterium]
MHKAARKTTGYYDKLSKKYNKQYHSYLRHTHKKMASKLKLHQTDEILDVSAGTGLLADMVMQKSGPFKRLVLNDPSEGMLAQAKYLLRHHAKVIEFTSHFSENLPFEDESFTQIICLNSFHYYVDQKAVMAHFSRLLKPGGTLWMLDWNRVGLFKVASFLIDLLSPEHINTRTLEETRQLCRANGFTVQDEEQWGFRVWRFFFLRCEREEKSL